MSDVKQDGYTFEQWCEQLTKIAPGSGFPPAEMHKAYTLNLSPEEFLTWYGRRAEPAAPPQQYFPSTTQHPRSNQTNQGGWIGLLVLFIGFMGWYLIPQIRAATTSAAPNQSAPSQSFTPSLPMADIPITLTVTNDHAIQSGLLGQPAIIGTVHNNTGRDLRYVEVKLEFLKNGTVVGTGWDNESGLARDQDWNFEAQWPHDVSADSYRITGAYGR